MRGGIAAAALLASLISSPALASDCSDAAEQYDQALDEVIYALNRYTRCLNGSGGRDDCSTEFRRLKNAQDDLEYAVSDIESYCEY